MASHLLRPTPPGKSKHDQPWKAIGGWGEKTYPAMPTTDVRETIRVELVADGVMSSDLDRNEVPLILGRCSRRDGKWVLDSPPR